MAPEPQAHAAMGLTPERERLSALGIRQQLLQPFRVQERPLLGQSILISGNCFKVGVWLRDMTQYPAVWQ